MAQPGPDGKMDIKEIPYEKRKQICFMLDKEQKWKPLAIVMGYTEMDVDMKFAKAQNSPSDELLTNWQNYCHSVLELFYAFKAVGAYECMELIKTFVPRGHWSKIKPKNKAENPKVQISNSKVDKQNFVGDTSKGTRQGFLPPNTRDNNITLHNEEAIVHQNNPNQSNPNQSFIIPTGLNDEQLSKFLEKAVIEHARYTQRIPYEELLVATNNWDAKLILGKGGFGQVFKGKWRNTDFAIKVLKLSRGGDSSNPHEDIRQTITELQCLNRYKHPNILPIYGYSVGGPNPCLVYEYMQGGALDTRLRPSENKMPSKGWLSWSKRVSIAIGVARGLQYLHTVLTEDKKPLVHCDIKTANILLDSQDEPRIGDFGLARKGPEITREIMKVSKIQGTAPYLPRDFIIGHQFGVKIDVYSYGVVLFELATGKAPLIRDINSQIRHLRDVVFNYQGNIFDLKDQRVPGCDFFYSDLIRLGKKCVAEKGENRPHMVEVLFELEETLKLGPIGNVRQLVDI